MLIRKKIYKEVIAKYEKRIKELEDLICPYDSHIWIAECESSGNNTNTYTYSYSRCLKCKKIKE